MYYLLTFESTQQAMEMEEVIFTAGYIGKLISLPTALSAGCGFALRFTAEEFQKAYSFIKTTDLIGMTSYQVTQEGVYKKMALGGEEEC